MKYVEWIRREYADGDYSLVSAFIVGNCIDDELAQRSRQFVTRDYVTGREPLEGRSWKDLTFVEYSVEESGRISFSTILTY
jgi:hypothetical protein